jgi:hypothetical protein
MRVHAKWTKAGKQSAGLSYMDGVTQSVHNGVNFGASASKTDSDVLLFLIPLVGSFFVIYRFRVPLSRYARLP